MRSWVFLLCRSSHENPSQLVSYLPFTSFMLQHRCHLCKRMLGMAREGPVWVNWACSWFGQGAEGLSRRDENQWC